MVFCFISYTVFLCEYTLAFSTAFFVSMPCPPNRVNCCRTSGRFSTSKSVAHAGDSSLTSSTSSNSSSSTILHQILAEIPVSLRLPPLAASSSAISNKTNLLGSLLMVSSSSSVENSLNVSSCPITPNNAGTFRDFPT